MRCDASETSGHVTTKSSICNWDAFYKSGVYATTVLCLIPLKGVLKRAPGGLSRVNGFTEIGEIRFDRVTEISRRHSRRELDFLKA
jgi:hypothetical protein